MCCVAVGCGMVAIVIALSHIRVPVWPRVICARRQGHFFVQRFGVIPFRADAGS